MFVDFIALPIFVIAMLDSNFTTVEKTNFTAPLWLIAFTNLSFLVNWAISVFKIYSSFAKIVWHEQKKVMNNQSWEELLK